MNDVRDVAPDLTQAATELRLSIGRIARRVRQAHAVGELTLSEISVLARLEREGPATPSVLAENERIRPQAMGTTLAALGRRGLVARAQDRDDGRRIMVTVTHTGAAVLRDRRSASTQRIARALDDGFTPAERRRLLDVLPLLDRLAQQL